MKNPQTGKGFRAGPSGACEAHLYAFTRFQNDLIVTIESPRLIAAASLLEAVSFLARHSPDFRVRAVEHGGVLVMLSGSPFS